MLTTPKVSIISQLRQRLLNLKPPLSGDIYGLGSDTGTSILLAGVSTTQLQHDAAILLPAGLQLLGFFTVTESLDQSETPAISSWRERQWLITVNTGNLTVHSIGDGANEIVQCKTISQEEFESEVLVCRTRYSLDLSSRDKTADVKDRVTAWETQLCNSACFALANTELVLSSEKEDCDQEHRDVQDTHCGVISFGANIHSPNEYVAKLLPSKSALAKGYKTVDCLLFELLQKKSCISTTNAPDVRVLKSDMSIQRSCLDAEAVAYVWRNTPIRKIGKVLLTSVLYQLKSAEYWLVKALNYSRFKGKLESVTTLPYRAGHLFSLIYPTCASEDDLNEYRLAVNIAFLLPKIPCMRRCCAFEFSCEKKDYHLYNTHIGLAAPDVAGLCGITQGIYSYHHYMQDSFNDNKWGCAYRSLQTIISWFKHQGFTTKPVPTHREIQQCLVSIGDKPVKFVGSTDWIGSTEVGFVLETYIGVTSRYINVSSGTELSEKGRELVHHFQTQGTPVMIGGGVLAHTILGVSWSPESGDISYLILDPHYTGPEDLSAIQKHGWCGWKGPNFWNSKAYYNLCLPQRPAMV